MTKSSTTYQPTLVYSMNAEQGVLGGLLINNELWDDVSLLLNEHNFYIGAHKIIFRVMSQLFEANLPVDVITLERRLKELNLLDQLDFSYLIELSKNTPSSANTAVYASIVKRDSQARELFVLGNELKTESIKVNSQESLETLLEKTEKKLTDLTLNVHEQETTVDLTDVLKQVLQKMDASCKTNSVVTGTSFGIERLDSNTAGAQNSDLIILAARPSMGKTALSIVFADGALESQKDKSVQYYSLEMPADQILQRFISMKSRVESQKLRQAMLMNDEDWARFSTAFEYINNNWVNRLLIDDSSYLTPQMLKTKVRRNVRKYGQPSMIIIDYLQLMSDPTTKDGRNRNLEIGNISKSLKELAKEINCPVVALSQLNRNLEQRADKRPMPSDLRDSGSLEQDADLLLFVYRDDVYYPDSELKGIAEIIIGKQRNGPIGTVMTKFYGQYSLFENIPDEEYKFGADYE